MASDLPVGVTDLIRRHLHSVLDIETLLLLRSRSEVLWSPRDLATALYIAEEAAGEHLRKLHASGLLAAAGGEQPVYRYEPRDTELSMAVDQLVVTYAQRRVRVIEYLYSRPLHSVRSFAGAFRLRRPPRK